MRNRLLWLALTGLFAGAVTLSTSGLAFAQFDDDDDDDDYDDYAEQDTGDDAAPEADAPAAGAYPIELLARPRVLPKGAWEAGVDLGINSDFSVIAVGSPDPFAPYQGGLGFTYGVNDQLNVGASYAFSLMDFEIKGGLSVHAAYMVMDSDSLKVRGEAALGYSAALESLGPITAGALVQYSLSPKMAVFTRPALVIAPEAPILETRPIYLHVPASFGYQVSPQIYAEVATAIAQINISDSDTALIIADFLPVSVTGLYSLSNMIDVGASLALDLRADGIGDTLAIGLLARYRGGL